MHENRCKSKRKCKIQAKSSQSQPKPSQIQLKSSQIQPKSDRNQVKSKEKPAKPKPSQPAKPSQPSQGARTTLAELAENLPASLRKELAPHERSGPRASEADPGHPGDPRKESAISRPLRISRNFKELGSSLATKDSKCELSSLCRMIGRKHREGPRKS